MQGTKRKIVDLLRMNGGLATGELGGLLGVSATAVRRHLNALEAQGLVCHKVVQKGMGRPSFIYELTISASGVFRQDYATFAASILQELTELGNDVKLDELFDRRQKRRRQQYVNLTQGETLNDRVASLARLMDSDGRMTTWQQLGENRFVLREHSCPFRWSRGKFDLPCRYTVSLLQQILKAKVRRVSHIFQGDVACAYEIVGPSNRKPGKPRLIPRDVAIVQESTPGG